MGWPLLYASPKRLVDAWKCLLYTARYVLMSIKISRNERRR